MRRGLFLIGILLSSAYVVLLYWLVGDKFEGLKAKELNEIGDFLAGVCSPLAFLWLVLGFLQQGNELVLSNKALQLQAEELRHSVNQQTRIADATFQQLKQMEEDVILRREASDREFSPKLQFHSVGLVTIDHRGVSLQKELGNGGHDVFRVCVSFEPPIGELSRITEHKLAGRGKPLNINFLFPVPEETIQGVCVVSYMRLDSQPGEEILVYELLAGGAGLYIERIASDGAAS